MSTGRGMGQGSGIPTVEENLLRLVIPVMVREIIQNVQETEEILRNEWQNRKRFLVARTPKFYGVLDPLVASCWIIEMEKTFKISECPENCKFLYASSMFRGQAVRIGGTS